MGYKVTVGCTLPTTREERVVLGRRRFDPPLIHIRNMVLLFPFGVGGPVPYGTIISIWFTVVVLLFAPGSGVANLGNISLAHRPQVQTSVCIKTGVN